MVNHTETVSPNTMLVAAAACEGGLLLAALATGWLIGLPPWQYIAWSWADLAVGLAATVPLLAGAAVVLRYPVGPLRSLHDAARQLVAPLFADCSGWQILVVSMLAGIGEEALFRGVVQQELESLTDSPGVALGVASLLFGLAHPINTMYVVMAALIGSYLGWLWLATGNLLVPIVTHAAYDFVAIAYLVSQREAVSLATPGEIAEYGPAERES